MPSPPGRVVFCEQDENGYHPKPTLTSIILGKEKALELYQKGLMVQKLYPNDTETYVQGVEDLQGHDGMFGVEKRDWEEWRRGKGISEQESRYRKKVR